MTVKEISLRLKNSEKTLTKRVLDYTESLTLDWDHPVIRELSQMAHKEFNDEVDDEILRIKMTR